MYRGMLTPEVTAFRKIKKIETLGAEVGGAPWIH